MAKHKKHRKNTADKKHLNFEEAKTMTIEEAVRQDSHLKAGIKEGDSVLDRYIKQHRDEIGAKKFETQSMKLDTQPLDNFIQKQRETVEEAGLLAEAADEAVEVVPVVSPDPFDNLDSETDSVLLAQSEPLPTSNPKKRALLLLGLSTVVVGLFAGGYWLSRQNGTTQNTTKPSTTTTQTDKKDSLKPASSEVEQSFDDLYASFFVDEGKTQLKNDNVGKLAELEASLKTLEGTSDYESAKALVERLRKQITALEKVNSQFTSPVIVDGQKVEASIAEGANFDQLSQEALKTGNADLDNALQAAISDGRQQQAQRAQEQAAAQQAQVQAEAQAAATQAAATAPAAPVADVSSGQTWTGPVAQATTPASVGTASPAATAYGITTYDPATLQRHLSRVPYNHDLVADVNNPAWLFNEGVLERILETSRARGYIVGNDFILERVNIINGNGYYNMFKPDGTYLFSINAKTGYFVGNGRGYADALDY